MKVARIAIAAVALMFCQSVLAAGLTGEKPIVDALAQLPKLISSMPKVTTDEIATAVMASASQSRSFSPVAGAGFQQSSDNLAIAAALTNRK